MVECLALLWRFCKALDVLFLFPSKRQATTKEKGFHESTSQKSLGVPHETAFNAGEPVKKASKNAKTKIVGWLGREGKV